MATEIVLGSLAVEEFIYAAVKDLSAVTALVGTRFLPGPVTPPNYVVPAGFFYRVNAADNAEAVNADAVVSHATYLYRVGFMVRGWDPTPGLIAAVQAAHGALQRGDETVAGLHVTSGRVSELPEDSRWIEPSTNELYMRLGGVYAFDVGATGVI